MRSLFHRELKPGFTLVEVLTVVGILGVLAGLTLAVSSPAREKARQTSCAAQLRQLHAAVMLYSTDVDAGEEVVGLGNFSCQVARKTIKVLKDYAPIKDIRLCPDVPNSLRNRMLTSYVWMPVPADLFPNPDQGAAGMLAEQARRIEATGQSFPMWACKVHDEIFYAPSEADVNYLFQKPFVLEVSVSGSIYAGRRPYIRTKSLASFAAAPEQQHKVEESK